MYKSIRRIASAVLTGAMILGSYISAQAAVGQSPLNITGGVYYVSTTGNDTNAGTLSAPFKTFKKATSMLGPGSTLYILPGVYHEALRMLNSGADGAWITVKPADGSVTIDLKNSSNPVVFMQGSYIALSNLEVKGSNDICLLSTGNYAKISGLVVHECQTHGIYIAGQHTEVKDNTVYATSLTNQTLSTSNDWGSGIKIGLNGNDILVEGNTVFHNYGEGIAATQGSNVIIRGNTVYDNFSVNIYIDNSFDILVEKNLVTCHPNSGFERDGNPASGIAMGEEYYSGWGAQLNRVTISNNIVAFCQFGVYYFGADLGLTSGGLKNSTVVYNTLWASTSFALGVEYKTGQTNSLIANNIIWQANNKLADMENLTGLTLQNNLWKVAPPLGAKGVGDRTGDPMFATTPGYAAETFTLSNLSPAMGGAVNIGVTTDYFNNPRGPSYEIGALQFLNTVSSPAPCTTCMDLDTIGVFRPSNGLLYLKYANITGFADVAINYGTGGDYPVAGDWDGNGTATIGIYRNGSFYLRNSNTLGFADLVFAFGQPGDQPVAGDWNGDGVDSIGVYRSSTGQFLLRNNNTSGAPDISFYLGNPGDIGITGDWNGDGVDTTGVFRPSNGVIFLKNANITGFADVALNYGLAGDQPVTGDWNNDGLDTIGIYRNGQFLLRNSNTIGFADLVFNLGNPGDMPIAGDWDNLP